MYNTLSFLGIAQTSLERSFVRYAKRGQENPFYLRRNPHYPFWWDVADSAFLQITFLSLRRAYVNFSHSHTFLRKYKP